MNAKTKRCIRVKFFCEIESAKKGDQVAYKGYYLGGSL
jgi:hypothetical protein